MIECKKCNLYQYRTKIVRGKGTLNPDFLLMGEAPGKDEDSEGFPFVGMAGKLLDKLLQDAQKQTEKKFTFFITNTIWCRPTDYLYGENRRPAEFEIYQCRPNVISLVQKVNPKNIILIGKVAEEFYGNYFKIYSTIQHPSYILRKGGYVSQVYMDNLQKLVEIFKNKK